MDEQPMDSGSESPNATAAVLEALLGTKRSIADLEVTKLKQVVQWVVVNEVDPLTHDQGPLDNRALRTAGQGSPFVGEFQLMEFSAVLDMSTDSGRSYVCRVAELRYRLPKLWDTVTAGDVPAWRALEVAKDTWTLPQAGAAFVDQHLAAVAGSCSWAEIRRLVEEATARFDPAKAEANRLKAADGRRFDLDLANVGIDGVVHLDAALDLADALDLEAAITSIARQLLALGCDKPLDVRRSIAAGELARAQGGLGLGGLDLGGGAGGFEAPRPGAQSTSTTGSTTGRSVVLHVHLTAAALTGAEGVARCANTRTPITVGQVRDWCGNTETNVTIQPVLDTDQHHHTEAYEIPARLRRQVEISIGTCVFPYCTRRAEQCDCDHTIAYNASGPTCSCNIAPLCRPHHRAKTHSNWSYVAMGSGTYLWTTPTGHDLFRDHRGTRRPPPLPPLPPLDDTYGPTEPSLHPDYAEP